MTNIKYKNNYRKLVRYVNTHFPVLMAKLRYRKLFKKKLNLKNPQNLNEKILWLSLFSDTSLWSVCADKYAVREYVKEKGLERILVNLYGKWDRAEDIEWEILPNSFVMKTNNGCGTVLLVRDKTKLNITDITNTLNRWLNKTIGLETTESHYKSIKPCIIAEELLEDTKQVNISSSLIDYKFWCFNGKVDSIWTYTNRNSRGAEKAVFDKNWNYHPEVSIFNSSYKEQTVLTPRPDCLDDMIKIAEILSSPFPVVRCDLYVVNGLPYFGELTFTSHGGTIDSITQAELLRMGQIIDLSGVKRIR